MKNSEIRIKLEKSTEIREVPVIETIVIRVAVDVDIVTAVTIAAEVAMIVLVVAIKKMIVAAVAVDKTIEVADTDVNEEMIAQAHVVLIVAEMRTKDLILQEVDIRNRVILIIDHVITEILVEIR